MYGIGNQEWNMHVYLHQVPLVYGVWHAYGFVQPMRFECSGLRLCSYIKGFCDYPKLIVMEKTIAAIL